MTRWGTPVTFTRSGGTLTNDADIEAKATIQGEQIYASTDIQIPCGGDVYLAVGSASGAGETLTDLRVTVAKSPSCPNGPANGNPGGQSVPEISGGGTDVGGPAAKTGCGCTSVDPMAGAFGLMVLAGLGRRRRIRG
jgi:MYXO-CTERM domain-containing protein